MDESLAMYGVVRWIGGGLAGWVSLRWCKMIQVGSRWCKVVGDVG